MKGMVPPDPHGSASGECFAVVHVPRRSRNRFPSASVQIVNNAQDAIDQSNPEKKRFPAIVHGPSKSSEGQMIYYLVDWIEKL